MVIKLFRIWRQKQLAVQVAALALYLLLAFVPFLSLLTGIAASIFNQSDIQDRVVTYIAKLNQPGLTNAVEQLLDGVQGFARGDGFIILFSLFVLLYGANGAFLQLRNAINNIQESFTENEPQPKTTWVNTFEDFFIGFIAIFVVLIGILAATVIAPIITWISQNTLEIVIPQLATLLQIVVNIGLVALVFIPLYKIIGRHVISWKASIIGGIVVSVGNLAANVLLGIYFDFTTTRSTFSLATTITALVTWLTVLATTIIIGGLAANYIHFSWRKNSQNQ